VVGGGFIGSEVASAARARGLEVTIVDSEPVPLARSLGPHMGAMCASLHEAAGTELRLGVGVDGFVSTNGSLDGVRLSDGEVIPAGLVVVGIGAAPATDWLRGSGVALHDRDSGVVCDGHLATSAPGVWAAGDVAWAPYALFDNDLMRVEHWAVRSRRDRAVPAGRPPGRNLHDRPRWGHHEVPSTHRRARRLGGGARVRGGEVGPSRGVLIAVS
jgi:NADPH-dependent 2,4-dienoyl-CoA reductase/sulfur reductase-like enzyme